MGIKWQLHGNYHYDLDAQGPPLFEALYDRLIEVTTHRCHHCVADRRAPVTLLASQHKPVHRIPLLVSPLPLLPHWDAANADIQREVAVNAGQVVSRGGSSSHELLFRNEARWQY